MIHDEHMGFWPFGKGKDKEEAAEVDFASRVIASSPEDGTTVRGKLTAHLEEPTTQERADATASACAKIAEELIRDSATHEDLLGREAELGAEIQARMGNHDPAIRLIAVVALHVVDDAPPSTVTPKPPSVAPRSVIESAPPSRGPSSFPPAKKPESIPPAPKPPSIPPPRIPDLVTPSRKADSTPLPRSQMPSSSGAAASRRHSSGQLLAVRSERLIPAGASAEATGIALVPLMRDASTKLLIAVLRVYDLLVVRRMTIDESSEVLAAIVPVSTAPLGLFADSRADELDRWESALGLLKLEALRGETATVTCFLLHQSLEHSSVPMNASTTILERIGEHAFDRGSAPLGQIGRYLHLIEGSPASELANAIIRIVGHREDLGRLEVALTPVLASLQEDLSFAATQAQSSLDSH